MPSNILLPPDVVLLGYCPTGPGGGKDPTCGKGASGGVRVAKGKFERSKGKGDFPITKHNGLNIISVSSGDNLPDTFTEVLRDNTSGLGGASVVYDPEAEAWLIPSTSAHHADYADKVAKTWELDLARGTYDPNTNTLTLMDMRGQADIIAQVAGRGERSVVAGKLWQNTKAAKANAFKVDGKKIKVKTMTVEDFLGGEYAGSGFEDGFSLPSGVSIAQLPDGVELAFCPTGPGGGIDNSCGKNGGVTLAPEGSKSTEVFKKDGKWSHARVEAVHKPAIAKILTGYSKSLNEKPTVFMSGGGMGSGKSALLDAHPEVVGFPSKGSTARSDPDAIKKDIPEYAGKIAAGDKNAAGFVHEESADISREAVHQGIAASQDIIYDTSGDSSIEKLSNKVAEFRERGAGRVEAHYAFPGSVEEAQRRADIRGEKTGRYVMPDHMKANHAEVSRVWQAAAERGVFDKLDLWSTAGPQGSKPTIIASAEGGKITVHDEAAFEAFTAIGVVR